MLWRSAIRSALGRLSHRASSARGRSGLSREGYEDFIQTDASINPGNSGGALVTFDGQLAGINSAILSPAGGNIGIGFAVPGKIARLVMTQLVQHGDVIRGKLGAAIQDIDSDMAASLGLDDAGGALIAAVEQGSPAAGAGLKPGDVVAAVDGRPVHGAADLRNRIGLTPVGSQIELTVWSGGLERTVKGTRERIVEAAFLPAAVRPRPGVLIAIQWCQFS